MVHLTDTIEGNCKTYCINFRRVSVLFFITNHLIFVLLLRLKVRVTYSESQSRERRVDSLVK